MKSLLIGLAKSFLARYDPPRQVIDLEMVTHMCVCGSTSWNIQAGFEDYEISWYLLDMECSNCLNRAKAPCLADIDPWNESYVTV